MFLPKLDAARPGTPFGNVLYEIEVVNLLELGALEPDDSFPAPWLLVQELPSLRDAWSMRRWCPVSAQARLLRAATAPLPGEAEDLAALIEQEPEATSALAELTCGQQPPGSAEEAWSLGLPVLARYWAADLDPLRVAQPRPLSVRRFQRIWRAMLLVASQPGARVGTNGNSVFPAAFALAVMAKTRPATCGRRGWELWIQRTAARLFATRYSTFELLADLRLDWRIARYLQACCTDDDDLAEIAGCLAHLPHPEDELAEIEDPFRRPVGRQGRRVETGMDRLWREMLGRGGQT